MKAKMLALLAAIKCQASSAPQPSRTNLLSAMVMDTHTAVRYAYGILAAVGVGKGLQQGFRTCTLLLNVILWDTDPFS